MKTLSILVAAALGICALAEAHSAIVTTTRYSYFTINGSTPASLYRGILSKGPVIGGSKAIATAAATAVQDGKLTQSGGTCRVADYRVKLIFTVTRPRLAKESALSPSDRALWRQFYGFVVAHEEQHKKNWMACAAGLDRQVSAIRASNCDKVAAKINTLWNQMMAKCDKVQSSFDAQQARALRAQPFMKRALGGAR